MHCQGITQFYLHTLHFIRKQNELYLPLLSQPQILLIHRPPEGRKAVVVLVVAVRPCVPQYIPAVHFLSQVRGRAISALNVLVACATWCCTAPQNATAPGRFPRQTGGSTNTYNSQAWFPMFSAVCLQLAATNSSHQRLSVCFLI